ncbi:HAD family hydrolase [Verminephrobacter eiseniae]|nr:HAD-IA family hydrolase [Verminephrobacter eiseniae]MCW5282962.1 HAD family hydrolase [Verminephrobacter eiseniae]MCW5303277.1 HAD family hydrolase [Verminephrobacter eiseniae]MCW8178136.1 HAD family hydrolase [Verminephrobacter eiseniae]MCW8188670.1 HAD family hydrolase [Verminephrobacter eiseniae]
MPAPVPDLPLDPVCAPPLDMARIRAISIDLDDTLWPIRPTIARAEAALLDWLGQHAPATAAALADGQALRALGRQVLALRPGLQADLSGLRREAIRLALTQAGESPALAEPAFDRFLAERQRVVLFGDAHDALAFLSARYPVVALSNGNADVQRIGIGHYFRASISASVCGVAKPDARIFHAAAQALRLPPQALLHVGDDATMDALGAIDAGMQAVWLNAAGHPWPHDRPPQATVGSLTALCRLLA